MIAHEDKEIMKVKRDLELKGYTCEVNKDVLEISYCGLYCGGLFRVRSGLTYNPESLGRLASEYENNLGKYMKTVNVEIIFWYC